MQIQALQTFYQRDMAVILADPALAEAHDALLQALERGTGPPSRTGTASGTPTPG